MLALPLAEDAARQRNSDLDALVHKLDAALEAAAYKQTKKLKKHCQTCNAKHEVLHVPTFTKQMGMNAMHVHQSTSTTVPIHFETNGLPVASMGWMGVHDMVPCSTFIAECTYNGLPDNPDPDDGAPHDVFSDASRPATNSMNTDAHTPVFEPKARVYDLPEVLDPKLGMHYVGWDGCIMDIQFSIIYSHHFILSIPGPMVDSDCLVFVLLGGHPRDLNWRCDVAEPITKLMEQAAQ
ncbi:hypothetical protein B0H10DRAFT_2207778 [Mycena sp. CBHHK59/15]|nr:hypothetical protein B0H10DRAFT_2207778 [Mycena sp. CBHHK59/15]